MSYQHEDLDIALTLEEFYQDCLLNGFTKRTVGCYHSSLKIWQEFLAQRGISELTDITRDNLLEYGHYLQTTYRCRKGNPLSISTIAQKLAALRSFLSFCVCVGKLLNE